MKYLSIKSMVWMAAMVSTPLSAQQAVPDQSVNLTSQFKISKVKYQDDEDNVDDKSFSNGIYYLNIAASGATNIYSTNDYTYGSAGCFYVNGTSNTFDVNVHLPDGHRINGIRYFYRDGSASSSEVQLHRQKHGISYTNLQTVASTGDTGNYKSRYENISTYEYVNNAEYSYVLRFISSEIGSNQQICGARLNMTPKP